MDFESFGVTNQVDDIDGFEPVQQPMDDQPQEEDAFGLGFGGDDQQQQQSSPEPQSNDFFFQQQPDQSPTSSTTPLPSSNTSKSPAKQAWDDKKAKQLAARKEQQQQVYQQNIANGKKELAAFQEKRGVHTSKIQATNRSEEKDNKNELEATMKNGTEWEKVAKYCDLKPKHDPKIIQQPNNTERMRSLLIDLKNDKTQKP